MVLLNYRGWGVELLLNLKDQQTDEEYWPSREKENLLLTEIVNTFLYFISPRILLVKHQSRKMKCVIFASLLASAAAFAPAAQKSSSTALNMAFESELGAQAPLGFFDPLGMLADADQERFDRLRYVELKHGRICMLGVVGYLTTYAGVRLPGDIDMSGTKFSDIGAGWDGSFAVPVAGAIQVLLFVGALELAVMKDVTGESEFPGDFRNGALDFGWDSLDAEAQASKRAIELNNGRAAQMGLLGLMVHDKLGNVDILIPN
jgi:hypothetical protein